MHPEAPRAAAQHAWSQAGIAARRRALTEATRTAHTPPRTAERRNLCCMGCVGKDSAQWHRTLGPLASTKVTMGPITDTSGQDPVHRTLRAIGQSSIVRRSCWRCGHVPMFVPQLVPSLNGSLITVPVTNNVSIYRFDVLELPLTFKALDQGYFLCIDQ